MAKLSVKAQPLGSVSGMSRYCIDVMMTNRLPIHTDEKTVRTLMARVQTFLPLGALVTEINASPDTNAVEFTAQFESESPVDALQELRRAMEGVRENVRREHGKGPIGPEAILHRICITLMEHEEGLPSGSPPPSPMDQ